MLINEIQKEITAALKSGQETKKNILKLILSETHRINKQDDQTVIAIIAKLIESNKETLAYGHNVKLVKENEVLGQFLPTYMNCDQIEQTLNAIKHELVPLNAGQAIGRALKFLKSLNLHFKNEDVKNVLEKMRA